MRKLWSETEKRLLWRKIWSEIAQAQSELGIITKEQARDIADYSTKIDISLALEIERETRHDLVSELHVFASQCKIGGGVIHLGATSTDIEDNADAIRLKRSVRMVREQLHDLLMVLSDLIEEYANHPTMGFTHLQPAEPTTLGYRFAQWAQDLLEDAKNLSRVESEIRGKGFKGAIGTSASYIELFGGDKPLSREFESRVLSRLGLKCYEITTQTYSRKQDYVILSALSSLGQSLYKMSFDIRFLQSPVVGEISEPFGKSQVGSSAMPFKKNPVGSENIGSLARHLAALPRVAWDNAAHSLLERTLDDSANRRTILPEGFLIADSIISRMNQILTGLSVNPDASIKLLNSYGVFSASEKLLMEIARRGGDRQEFHEIIRMHAMNAWNAVQAGEDNPFSSLLAEDPRIKQYLSRQDVLRVLGAKDYIGDANLKALEFSHYIVSLVKDLESNHGSSQ